MTPRLFVALLQPLLVLLLLTGAPTAERIVRDQGSFVCVNDSSHSHQSVSLTLTKHSPNGAWIQGLGASLINGEDGPDGSAEVVDAVLDFARFIRIGRSAYPGAPPSHKPCAAPSTGPPVA